MKRLYLIFFTFLIGFAALFLQFFKLQVLEHEKWEKVADGQHYFTVETPAKRGTIYTSPRFGEPLPLSVDVEVFDLYADPKVIPKEKREEIVLALASLVGLDDKEVNNIRTHLAKKSRRRKLLTWLEDETKLKVQSWWSSFSKAQKLSKHALFFESNFKRVHPSSSMLGQVLHTVRHLRDEKSRKAEPTGGLELAFNDYLEGKGGIKRYLRSPLNTFEIGETVREPEAGGDLYLTIHPTLQAIAEEEVEFGVKRCSAKRGWSVIVEPKTGHILALAQYPFFDLPLYPSYFETTEKMEETRVKSMQDAQEPGSVMKAFTIAVGLLANEELSKQNKPPIFSPEEKFATSNSHFPGRKKPLEDTHLHYFLNMWMGLQKSSNIYMALLAQRVVDVLGEDWYRNVLIDCFGFGKKTGIPLPSESLGLVPKPGRLHPNGALEWSKGTPYCLAMGHNILATSLQLCRAMSVFANGGHLVEPSLIETFDGQPAAGPKVLSDAVLNTVLRAMRFTTKPGGTARRADIPGFTVVGKTSTPKKLIDGFYSEKIYVPCMCGFAPVSDPAIVCIVVMDEPKFGYVPGRGLNHHGGTASAPIFQRIVKRSLEALGIAPDDPYNYPEGDPRRDSSKAEWVTELQDLDALYQLWNGPSNHH